MTDFQQFESGAVRDTQEGKIKFELITPTFKKDLAAMLTDKAKHYGDRNWEKGIPTARTFSSLMRHVEALGRGEWLDEESGHPHTVLAAANLMFIHEFHGTEFDTLKELIGPALRNVSIEMDYAKAFPTGSLRDEVINHGEPEPDRNSILEDKDGDRMLWDRSRGWYYPTEWVPSDEFCPWEDIHPVYFPMVRVS